MPAGGLNPTPQLRVPGMSGSPRRPDEAAIYGGNLDGQNDFVLGQLASKMMIALEGSDNPLSSSSSSSLDGSNQHVHRA